MIPFGGLGIVHFHLIPLELTFRGIRMALSDGGAAGVLILVTELLVEPWELKVSI